MPSKKRAPGAQPGNANALRHGFYSRKFKDMDLKDLAAMSATIEQEIALLRVATRRRYEWANH